MTQPDIYGTGVGVGGGAGASGSPQATYGAAAHQVYHPTPTSPTHLLRPIRVYAGRGKSHGIRVFVPQQLAEQWQLLERHQRSRTHAHERVQWPQHL